MGVERSNESLKIKEQKKGQDIKKNRSVFPQTGLGDIRFELTTPTMST